MDAPLSFKQGMNWPFLIWGLGWAGLLMTYVVMFYTDYMRQEYIHEQQSVHLMISHLIWCPKRRRKVLVGPVRDRLERIIHEVADEHSWQIIELAIQPDHVHLFIRSNPYTLPTDMARLIKGRSAHHLRKEFSHLQRMPSLWTRSTFYSTAGNVSSEIIQQYIARQSTE